MCPKEKTYFIHVGKTGGTAIKDAARAFYNEPRRRAPQTLADRLVLHSHISLAEAERDYGAADRIAFAFRNPTERFVSGFYCRRRMGLPQHHSPWDAKEAAAFAHFSEANDLAESLSSDNELRYSAAVFAMGAIRHLRRGYSFHFGKSMDFILDTVPRVVACIDTKNMKADGAAFLEKIGVDRNGDNPFGNSKNKTSHEIQLSDRARENLQKYWQAEYAYYEVFRELEASLM